MKSSDRPSSTSPRRRYDASGRQAAAQERQRQVLRAATDLFLEQGYGATSIDQIAKAAGVSSQSVYAAFESKAGILERALGLARTGDEHGSVSRSPAARPVIEQTDLRARCRMTAQLLREQYERAARLIAIVEGAAAVDPALADLHARFRADRRASVARFNGTVPADAFRTDLSRDAMDDVMTLLSAGHVYTELVDALGWTPQQYEDWITETYYRLCFARDLEPPPTT